jgi:hypothetical protein
MPSCERRREQRVPGRQLGTSRCLIDDGRHRITYLRLHCDPAFEILVKRDLRG